MKKTAAVSLAVLIGFVSLGFAQSYLEEVRACELLSQGKIEDALALLNRKLNAYPDNMDCLLYKGLAFYLKGDMNQAMDVLTKLEFDVDSISKSPASMTADVTTADVSSLANRGGGFFTKERKGILKFSLGVFYKNKEDYKNAQKRFNDALKADYPEVEARQQLLIVHAFLKDYRKSADHLKKLQKKGESSPSLTFMEGFLSYHQKDQKKAEEVFSSISGEFVEAKKNLAVILYNQGSYQKSLDIWLEILAESPLDAQALRNSGRAYFHLGQKDKGQEQFDKAGLQMGVETYSPKTIPLVLVDFFTDITFDFQCQAK